MGGRYDSEAGDILALQDDIVRKVLIEVRVKLTSGDHARLDSRGAHSLDAWLLCGQAFNEWAKFTREANFRAIELFEAAHLADPGWARPLAGLAATHREAAIRGWGQSREQDLAQATGFAERAVELGPTDPTGYIYLGYCRLAHGDAKAGIALMERALELAPNDIIPLAHLAYNLPRVGQEMRALTLFARARKLRPIPSSVIVMNIGFVHHLLGQHEQAIEAMNECLSHSPLADARVRLAAIYADLGRLEEARSEIERVLAGEPDANIKEYTNNLPFPNEERLEWYIGLLRTAGLPDD